MASKWRTPNVLQESQQDIGSKANVQDLLAALNTCSKTRNLRRGKQSHAEAVECGHNSNVYIVNALINMYGKCGSMPDARKVFDSVKSPDVVSWTALILGYADNEQGHIALDLFTRMRTRGPSPDSVTFVAALKACSSIAAKGVGGLVECMNRGQLIHNSALENGCNIYVLNTLVDMYAKCGSILHARNVFDSMKRPDVISWNAMIMGYADNGQGHNSLILFSRMRNEGPTPNSLTFVAVLTACICLATKGATHQEFRDKGNKIHNISLESGCCSDVYVQNKLVHMYSKCGRMVDARLVFDGIHYPTLMTWTSLISGYAENGQGRTALALWTQMRDEGPPPDSVTFVASLQACVSLVEGGASRIEECRDTGKQIHNIVLENGCSSDVYLQSTLIDMYAKCSTMVDAREVFDSLKHPDVVSWTALISGYADNEENRTALNLFTRMRTEGPAPNSVTIVAALKACASLALKEASERTQCRSMGKQIHYFALENGYNDYVQNTLIDMYSKCGSMVDACEVFDNMKHPDVVSWNVLILGYADNGQGHNAMVLFTRMRIEGPAPNSLTFVAAFKACALVGALEFGRAIHSEINIGIDFNVVLVTSMVDFYAKCGSLVEARNIFDLHEDTRNVVTWTALLAGFSSCGDNKSLFALFDKMQGAGFRPDGITFLCILTCCSHSGLVDKGKECFDSMPSKFEIVPTLEHHQCMIDIFGRANKFDDAFALLHCMPFSPNIVTWMIILSACRKWKNVEIGKLAFESLIDLNDGDAAPYVLMGQIYGSRGMLQEQESMRFRRQLKKACKIPGESHWTNEEGEVHTFLVESNHPQNREIHDKWESIRLMMRKHGFVCDTLDKSNPEETCCHSERLALVCALINSKPGQTIRIVKHSRVCDDCHTAIALVSKLESRLIVCRDASRLHVLKDGKCSCSDGSVFT